MSDVVFMRKASIHQPSCGKYHDLWAVMPLRHNGPRGLLGIQPTRAQNEDGVHFSAFEDTCLEADPGAEDLVITHTASSTLP